MSENLAKHLYRMGGFSTHLTEAQGKMQARTILSDPQAHIDALVAAGVLKELLATNTYSGEERGLYTVVQPHVHEWRVNGIDHDGGTVRFACQGCGVHRHAPNRLPIEVPDA